MRMPKKLRELVASDPVVEAYIRNLEESSTLDPVTTDGDFKILNRRGFDIAFAGHFNEASQHLSRDTKRSRRIVVPDISLLLFDLARFGSINNKYGHDAGDTVLRYVGRSIARKTRPYDEKARWGGDEFALLMPRTRYLEAIAVVRRVLDFVWEHRPGSITEFGFYGGLATYDAESAAGIANFANFFTETDARLRQARTYSNVGENSIVGNNGKIIYSTSSPSTVR